MINLKRFAAWSALVLPIIGVDCFEHFIMVEDKNLISSHAYCSPQDNTYPNSDERFSRWEQCQFSLAYQSYHR